MPFNANRHPLSHAALPESINDDISADHDQDQAVIVLENRPMHTNILTNIDSLRTGDLVDAFDSVRVWAEAEILKVDRQLGNVFITYLNWDNSWDEWIRIGDRRIAKLHSHTYVEGEPFQIGQRIEVQDTRHVWLEAFVADMDFNRIFVHYKGWSAKFDEWLDMHDLSRIRPFGRSKRGFQIKRKEGRFFKIPQRSDDPGGNPGAAQAKQSSSASRGKLVDRDPESNRNPAYRRRIAECSAQYSQYKTSLLQRNLQVVPVSADGNCLFRSVAHQVYGDEELHGVVREKCMDYMELNASFFSQFIEGGMETFHLYISAKRISSCWGDDPEIQSMCELYNRPADIWAYDHQRGARKLRTFHEAASGSSGINTSESSPSSSFSRPIMRLSYYGGGHYDSIVSNGEESSTRLRLAPGELEDNHIALIRRNKQLQQHGGGGGVGSAAGQLEEAKRSTDREETERVTLEMAIQRSRAEHLRWADEDLESCLMNSFSTINIVDATGDGSASSKRELEAGADMAPSRGEHKEGKCVKMAEADLAHVQSEMIRCAKEESERLSIELDLLERAKSASLADTKSTLRYAVTGGVDSSHKDGLFVAAGDVKGDVDLKLALSLSQEEQLQAAISASLSSVSSASDDDAMLMQALQMSLGDYGAGDEDADLNRAIELSLRK